MSTDEKTPNAIRPVELSRQMNVATLPEHWSKFLLGQPETGMDYQIVAVTLRDGRFIDDVAIVHHSLVAQVRGHADIPFDPADITGIDVTHRKWDFQQSKSR